MAAPCRWRASYRCGAAGNDTRRPPSPLADTTSGGHAGRGPTSHRGYSLGRVLACRLAGLGGCPGGLTVPRTHGRPFMGLALACRRDHPAFRETGPEIGPVLRSRTQGRTRSFHASGLGAQQPEREPRPRFKNDGLPSLKPGPLGALNLLSSSPMGRTKLAPVSGSVVQLLRAIVLEMGAADGDAAR